MTQPSHDWNAFALLLIDVQYDFWSMDVAEHFPRFPTRITRLLRFCRAEGLDVIHLRARFAPDGSDWMPRYTLRGRTPCVAGTPGADVLPFAVEAPGETVIVKQTFDGFLTPELLPTLQQRGKRFLLTAGLVTSTCVLLTTASAAQRGFLTAVVEDCTADSPTAHDHTLNSYGFVFDRTPVKAIPDHYDAWTAALDRLATRQTL